MTEVSRRTFIKFVGAAAAVSALPMAAPVQAESSSEPTDWLFCDGARITSGEFPELHAMIGDRLPDMRAQLDKKSAEIRVLSYMMRATPGDPLTPVGSIYPFLLNPSS